MPVMASGDLPSPLARRRRGRVLGGVCAGLAARSGRPVGHIRAAFVTAGLVFGLGLLAYLASWLILPAEGEDGEAPGARGIVLLAQASGALVALAALAALGAVATVFGFGWAVVAVGAAVLAGTLAGWPRVGPAWALLPIGALTLPSVALAVGGLRIDPQTAPVTVAPRTVAALPATLRSGLGLLEVDLRHTALPTTGTIALRVEAGVRRTLVALPHARCVRVEVRQRALPAATRLAAAALGRGLPSTPGVTVFGQEQDDPVVAGPANPTRRGPTLQIDFSSAGGKLVVRDYPVAVDPAAQPDWPGYAVYPEPRPDTTGLSARDARRELRAWRRRHRIEVRDQRAIERLMGGPCARRPERRKPRANAKHEPAGKHR